MAKKCTKLERERRIQTFVRLLANGAVNSDLVQFASKEWGIGRRQSDQYIADARNVLIEDINQDRHVVAAEMLAVCRTLIKNGIKSNQLNVVLGAVNTVTRLGGLEPK